VSKPTDHGENIAWQIQGEDAYGRKGKLTLADVWMIIDNLHTHFMDTDRDTSMFERWMRELEDLDSGLPI